MAVNYRVRGIKVGVQHLFFVSLNRNARDIKLSLSENPSFGFNDIENV